MISTPAQPFVEALQHGRLERKPTAASTKTIHENSEDSIRIMFAHVVHTFTARNTRSKMQENV